jgi:hypothetical protein
MIQRPKNNPRNGDDSGSLPPKKFKPQKSSRKLQVSVFLDKDDILLVDYLENGRTITANYYVALNEVLCCNEAVTGLQMSTQAFERNLIPSRQCCSQWGGHYAPEIGRSSL